MSDKLRRFQISGLITRCYCRKTEEPGTLAVTLDLVTAEANLIEVVDGANGPVVIQGTTELLDPIDVPLSLCIYCGRLNHTDRLSCITCGAPLPRGSKADA